MESEQDGTGAAGSRLMIQKMVLENFKSYGGVREIGPFHKRFSSIVGPNGSGKSNVIDAMLFVFGHRAKKLRLNKVSELIHKSETFPNLDSARVSVHFADVIDTSDGADSYTVVPGSQLVVTRTAYDNNSSKYHIDSKGATFKEVGELLRKRGIDLDNNRFLILQGEVEQIAMMKPKAPSPHEEGLLEYLEDIIGSNCYVERIEAAGLDVEAKCDLRLEKLNRLKIAEKERESLEETKSEAEAYVTKEDAIRREKNALYQKYVAEAERSVAMIEQRTAELDERLAAERAKRVEVGGEAEVAKKEVKTLHAAHTKLAKGLAARREEFSVFERRDIELREELKHFKASAKKLEATSAKEAAEILAKQAAVAAHEGDDKLAAEAAVAAATEAAAEADAELAKITEALAATTAEVRKELAAKQKTEVAPAKDALSAAVADVDAVSSEIECLQAASSAARTELAKVDEQTATLDARAAEKERALVDQREEIGSLEKRRNELQNSLAENGPIRTKEADAERAGRAALVACEEAKAVAQRAREASKGGSVVVQKILAAAQRGGKLGDAGVIGRLGELGAIGAKYDAAVSTCCDTLDHVVVETSAGGQRCIEFLRANSLGRANFLVLDEVTRQCLGQSNAACRTPGKSLRLFDLVQPSDARFKPAFYMALRDTLVADNLDAGMKLAYGKEGRWRVVTLGGQVIDTSGTMSGGGGKPRTGRMRLADGSKNAAKQSEEDCGVQNERAMSEQELKKLEKNAETAALVSEECSSQRRKLEDELRAVLKRLTQLQTSIPKLEVEQRSVLALRQQLTGRVERLRGEAELDAAAKKKLKELEQSLKKLGAVKDSKWKACDALEGEVKALRQKILDAGGKPLKLATKRAAERRQAADDGAGMLSKLAIASKAAAKALAKAKTAKAKCETELAQVLAKEEKALVAFEDLEETAAGVKDALDSAQHEECEASKELAARSEQLEQLELALAAILAAETEIKRQLGDYGKAVTDNKNKAKHWRKELVKLQQEHAKELLDYGDVLGGGGDKAEAGGGGAADGEEPSTLPNNNNNNIELPTLAPEELFDPADSAETREEAREQAKLRLALLEAERDAMRGEVNLGAIEDYRKRQVEYRAKLEELEQATDARNAARELLEDLKRKRLDDFMKGFAVITLKLKEMYQMITLGGDAELELVDSLDPFSEGIVFSVRPPKKSWKHIANLSGGEKTLSSLALVFALHHYKPTPLYVMDEIDAALDYKNVSIIANYIKERCQSAQFIIISLRNNMFELADRLVGIYKTNNITKTITISPEQFAVKTEGLALRDATNEPTNAEDAAAD